MDARRLDRQGGAAHAGPGQPGDDADALQALLLAKRRHAQVVLEVLRSDLHFRLGIAEQADHRLAHDPAQLLLQLAHAGFAGIAFDHRLQCAVADRQTRLGHARLGQLLGPQVALGDGQLLFGDVAGEADHFHAVEQGPWDRVEGVGGADEQHLGQVQAQVEVVVEEVDVLLRVEGFQQR
ncbi:hypothetical protein D3C81_1696770 [compost metagenome]